MYGLSGVQSHSHLSLLEVCQSAKIFKGLRANAFLSLGILSPGHTPVKPDSAKELKVTRFKQDSVSLKDRQYTEQAWLPGEAAAQYGESQFLQREDGKKLSSLCCCLVGYFLKSYDCEHAFNPSSI